MVLVYETRIVGVRIPVAALQKPQEVEGSNPLGGSMKNEEILRLMQQAFAEERP